MAKVHEARDYKLEKHKGQLELLKGLEIVRDDRAKDTFDILQLAQIFVFCSLPYRPTEERQISHTARLRWIDGRGGVYSDGARRVDRLWE